MGNDPEVFVKTGQRVVVSEKIGVASKDSKSTVKQDNAAVELNMGPAECLQQENAYIAQAVGKMRSTLDKYFKSTPYRVSLRPVEQIAQEDIKKFRTLCQFGCEPSLVFHPTDGLHLSAPNVDPMRVRHRSIGYHVHMGWDTPDKAEKNSFGNKDYIKMAELLHSAEGRVRIVQMCDLLAGLPAVLLERDERVPIRRATLGYGKAGEFREQPHGFEYRTLGPWPMYRPMWAWWANAAVRDAFQIVFNNNDSDFTSKLDMVAVSNAINTNNFEEAKRLWVKVKKILWPMIESSRDDLSDRHPMLSRINLKNFEFIVGKGGLSYTMDGHIAFSFDNWLGKTKQGGSRKEQAYFEGFPSKAFEICTVDSDYPAYSKAWRPTGDNISKLGK